MDNVGAIVLLSSLPIATVAFSAEPAKDSSTTSFSFPFSAEFTYRLDQDIWTRFAQVTASGSSGGVIVGTAVAVLCVASVVSLRPSFLSAPVTISDSHISPFDASFAESRLTLVSCRLVCV